MASPRSNQGGDLRTFVEQLDDDVVITDLNDVIWAVTTTCNIREETDRPKSVET
ncbi:MAG: hypothetical protein V3T02_00755 [Alphaproteobacteria bacterium]